MELLHRRTPLDRLVRPVRHAPLPYRRTGLERLAKRVGDSRLPTTVKSNLPEVHPPKAVKSGLAAVGGAIGLTAASAAVSARRRRSEESSDRS